jgi:hypothetical protein
MAFKKQLCVNHSDRPAIGVCVITGKPICAECSTRYEGVNYSREGLEIVRRDRQASLSRSRTFWSPAVLAGLALSPLALYLLYLFLLVSFKALLAMGEANLS